MDSASGVCRARGPIHGVANTGDTGQAVRRVQVYRNRCCDPRCRRSISRHRLRLVHQHRDVLERLGVTGLVHGVVLKRRCALGAHNGSRGRHDRRSAAIEAVVRLIDASESVRRGQVHRDVVLLPARRCVVAGDGRCVVDQDRRRLGGVLVVGEVM